MHNILNITNGDCAVELMQLAVIPGTYLPWQDVLHQGPVPEGLDLEELSRIRAQYIADCDWGEFSEVYKNFIHRDEQLQTYHQYDKVILWFEHDLYDQLQILQILDWLNRKPHKQIKLTMICTDRYLGTHTPDEFLALLKHEKTITNDQLALATKAWAAFRSPTPCHLIELLKTDTSALPFLQAAILRLLEEYPGTHNGLSRTAHMALKIIASKPQRPEKVFGLYQQTEARRFLGDSSFWLILQGMLQSQPALITQAGETRLNLPSTSEQTLEITNANKQVLCGSYNWLNIAELDLWIGGVHFTRDNIWLWDNVSKRPIHKSI